jgi:alpha-L-arabinofuranosidase
MSRHAFLARTCFLLSLVSGWILPLRAETTQASLEVNASVTLTSFKPLHVFGNNANGWADPLPIQKKVEAAGNYLMRIPGGSWGDIYHWNGKGSFDKEGHWVPSDTEYEPSWIEKGQAVRDHASRVLDGDEKTVWRSNRDTDFPNHQWLYVNLGVKKTMDRIDLTWGDPKDKTLPYAKRFDLQYWDPADGRQWMPYGADKAAWLDLKKDLVGKGGKQSFPFPATETQYLRVRLRESSEGKDGTYTIAELRLFAAGQPVSLASWGPAVASSTHGASSGKDPWQIVDFEKFMTFTNAFSPKAVPLVIVNFGTGTPQEAAAWVRYANQVRGYGIKYWEVGNEVGGDWEAGGPLNVDDYARRYIKFYEAMKAADPTITIFPNVGATDSTGLQDGKPSLGRFLERLAQEGKEKYLEVVSLHQYPSWDSTVPNLLAAPKTDMANLAATIKAQLSPYPALKDIPVWISEYNTSDHIKPHDISVRLDNGLWLATYLGEFIRNFGPRAFATMWDIQNGGSAIKEEHGGDHGYLQAEAGPYQYQERADYWAMTQLTNHWSLPGDARDHFLVEATTDAPLLSVFANARPDGKLTLLVVNKDPENDVQTDLRMRGFRAAGKGRCFTFDKTNYQWKTDQPPYHADPSKAPTETPLKVKSAFTHTFPAYSITVMEFSPKGSK